MIIKKDINIGSISWLAGSYTEHSQCLAENYYVPETLDELTELCRDLYNQKKEFDLVGHTSNIYFRPNYKTENLISTRKINKYLECENTISCQCGVSVKTLSKEMVDKGIEGFAGLIDLPGTVAAAIYGNASCFGDSISKLLHSLTLLLPNGKIKEYYPVDLKFQHRSSSLKRHEMKGVILTVTLNKICGDVEKINLLAQRNHDLRMKTQPGPKNNLGSVFKFCSNTTVKGIIIKGMSVIIAKVMHPKVRKNDLYKEKTEIACLLMNRKEISKFLPYGFNRYIWSSPRAHDLFDIYINTFKSIYKNAELEIEIKG
ncbi:FAD-binding protein [Prevotella koreensis]